MAAAKFAATGSLGALADIIGVPASGGVATTPKNTTSALGVATAAGEQAINDLIESVALEQAGLSRILNAEGEKIQRVVNGGGTFAEAMAVNCSVQEMIGEITRLEFILQRKLNLVLCEVSICDGHLVYSAQAL